MPATPAEPASSPARGPADSPARQSPRRRGRASPASAETVLPGNDSGAAAAPSPATWLVLVYRVPSEPTRLRAAVWRRIKSLGAIYLQSSVAALPATSAAERALRKLRSEIADMSGTAILMSCEVLAGQADILAQFQTARNDEYEEIVDKCADFISGIDKEYVDSHFSYAELEENEVDLVKLRTWLARVRERDIFGADGQEQAVSCLAECEEKLEAYAARVYAEEAESR